MKEVLYATGAFEIGDCFLDGEGTSHTITDVLVCHYLREGKFVVLYETDGSGSYVKLTPYGETGWDPYLKPQQKLRVHKDRKNPWRK